MSNKVFRILFGLLVISAIAMLGYYRGTDVTPFNSDLFFWALLFGSIAALIDGSLGMAYGVTGTAFLLEYLDEAASSLASSINFFIQKFFPFLKRLAVYEIFEFLFFCFFIVFISCSKFLNIVKFLLVFPF